MIKTNLHNPQCAQTLENHCWGIPLPPAPHVPRRASRAKKTHLSVDLARDHFQTTPPTPVYQMKGPNGLCTGLYATCAQTPKAARAMACQRATSRSELHWRYGMQQAGHSKAAHSALPRVYLNSQVCCGDGEGSARWVERPCASRVRNLNFTHTGPPVSR